MKLIRTCDNNKGNLVIDNVYDLENIRKIANIRIDELITKNPHLLIFPSKINGHNDDIYNKFIFSLLDKELTTYNIMGFVGINNTQINISSRFDNSENDYFLHYMLQKVFRINFFDLKVNIGKESMWDFLLYLFPYYLGKALNQGLYKEYVRNKYNNANVKGVIDIKKHININCPFSGNIAYSMREHTFDNPVLELIRHTIEFIKTNDLGNNILSSNSDTIENVRQIIDNTSNYNKTNREKIINVNNKPIAHPYFTAYKSLQRICLQILRYKRITFGVDKDKVYGILFDGAWLWEEYLNIIFKENKMKLDHPLNKEKKNGDYLFQNGHGYQPIFPDFIRRKEGHKTAWFIGDAKYKHIDKRNAEISKDDYYQVITYMYRYECSCGYIFFPFNGTNKQFVRCRLIDGITENRTIIELGLKIPEYHSSFRKFVKSINENEMLFFKYVKKPDFA